MKNIGATKNTIPPRVARNINHNTLRIIPFTIKELCWLYNISYRILKKKLAGFSEELGKKEGYYYSLLQVWIIIKHLGKPKFSERLKGYMQFKSIKNNVSAERAILNTTQATLAKAVFVSRQTINSIELMKSTPSLVVAFRIADYLGKPLQDIFFLEDWQRNIS